MVKKVEELSSPNGAQTMIAQTPFKAISIVVVCGYLLVRTCWLISPLLKAKRHLIDPWK